MTLKASFRAWRWMFAVALATTLCWSLPVWADDGVDAERLYKMERLAALDADLPGAIQALAEQWSGPSGFSADELFKTFQRASSDQLLALQDATSINEVDRILLGGESDTVNPLTLGSLFRDYVYTPVEPCRIVDTRIAVGGGNPIPANTTRDFHVHGTTLIVAQGGNIAGCIAPQGEPRAVHVNVTVVPAGGNGHVRVFPDGRATPPTASLVNFKQGTNIANAATIETRFSTNASTPDISVFVANAPAHVIMDVMGYYYPATEQLEEREFATMFGIPASITTIGSLSFFAPGPGKVVVRATATGRISGDIQHLVFGVVDNLGGGYDQFNEASINIAPAVLVPMVVEEVYSVSGSGFHTYYIRAETSNTATTDIERPVLIAHYVPD